MVERAGLQGSEVSGIFFTEDKCPQGVAVIKDIDLLVKFRQNLNLTNLKERAAKEIQASGANALVEMKYGQRAKVGIFTNGEQWYLKGRAVRLD
jgi:hypothetical protein